MAVKWTGASELCAATTVSSGSYGTDGLELVIFLPSHVYYVWTDHDPGDEDRS